MKSEFLTLPEGRLRVLTAGSSGSPVLLLSGAGLDSALLSWKYLIPALSPDHRVLALDWPKQGESRPWDGRADHRTLLRCISATLDHFEIERTSLVGLSQGGALSLAFAIDNPSRVDRLVAIAPGGIIDFPPLVHQGMWLLARFPRIMGGLSTLALRNRKMVRKMVSSGLFAGPSDDFDTLVDEITAEVKRVGVRASDWQNDSIGWRRMRIDLRPDLHRVECPTLLIQGANDVAVKPRFTREAARLIPEAELQVLKDHGHWPNRQSPELVNELIINFLTRR